jgi:3-deoxy-D-manno-octulosonic-acid transferase
MTDRSFERWRRNRGMARPLFSRFNLVLAQNERLARRFSALGAPKVSAFGNLKVDSPPPPVDLNEYARLRAALEGRPVLIAASTHEGEEQIIADAHRLLARDVKGLCTIIAPRHPYRGDAIAQMLRSRGFTTAQRSRGETVTRDCETYLADTIGELGLFYKLATVAFIGGSLVTHGGQNPIEAVRQGVMVLTGPHRTNFTDAYRVLLDHQAAIEVNSAEDIAAAAGKLFADPAELIAMRKRATDALSTVAGALPRTVEALLAYMPREEERVRAT